MAPRNAALAAPILALAAAALLVMSGPASAIYVITPLTLTPSQSEAEVGDALTLDIAPEPEHENATSWADREVRVRYGWNPNEGQEGSPDQPTSDEEEVSGDVGILTLDADARGSLAWTVPAEADDKNVFFQVVDAEGEVLATAHVRVGDAPHMMTIMRGSEGGIADSGEPIEGTPPAQDADESAAQGDERRVPGAGLLAAAGVVGLAALAMRRRS